MNGGQYDKLLTQEALQCGTLLCSHTHLSVFGTACMHACSGMAKFLKFIYSAKMRGFGHLRCGPLLLAFGNSVYLVHPAVGHDIMS